MRILLRFLSLISLLSSRGSKSKYPYAIRDFRSSIQPYLKKMVSSGIVQGYETSTSFLDSNTTDTELKKLSLSEHPILRAEALTVMATEDDRDCAETVLSHLDDTDIVTTNEGEFGFGHKTVADCMLERSRWKSEAERSGIIEKLVTQHNYLASAYKILFDLQPLERYYAIIKEMAQRDRPPDDIQYALFALARYKKAGDIPFIKEKLLKYIWFNGDISFTLMREFPDSAYMDVLEFYKTHFYYEDVRSRKGSRYENFFNTIACYKNDRSAAELNNIKNDIPFLDCGVRKSDIQYPLYYAIWNNPCKAYFKLIREVKPFIDKCESYRYTLTIPTPVDLEPGIMPRKPVWLFGQ